MAKQLTAPGCKYSIVARVDTTIYSPDQTWILDVPAGQTDFIAETNEIIIPADAMMCRKKCQIDADLARFNVLGRGAGSLATFVTRAIEQVVGKGNAKVEYGDGKMTVSLTSSVTAAQFAEVENLLARMLPKDVVLELDEIPLGYMRVEFLESTGTQYMLVPVDGTTRDDITIEAAKHDVTPTYSQLIVIRNALGYDFSDMCHSNDTAENGLVNVGWRLDPLTISGVDRPPVYQWNAFPRYAADTRYRQDWHGKTRQLYFNGELVSTFSGSDKTPDCATTAVRLFKGWADSAGLIYSVKYVREDGDTLIDMIPALDPTGAPCMINTATRTAYYNDGTGQFIVGLTTAQALDLANLPVPTTNNTLTISLSWDAQWDAGVQKALATAAAKGWTITVQYRDPEVATENIPVSFLESTGEQYINSQVNPGTYVNLDLTFELTKFPSTYGVVLGKNQMEEVGVSRLNIAISDTRNLQAEFGWWSSIYTYSKLFQKTHITFESEIGDVYGSKATVNGEEKQQSTLGPLYARGDVSTLTDPLWFFARNTSNEPYAYSNCRIYHCHIETKTDKTTFIPALDKLGTPGLYCLETKKLLTNQGTGAFIAGFDTAEQIRKLATLPDVTSETDETKKSLTVSMPLELAFDAGVKSALDVAAARGWTIIVQYRESEVATANLDADFLESTGTQYIELPFHSQNILGAEIEYIDFNANTDAPMMSCSRYNGSYERFYLPYTSSNIGYYGWVDWVNIGTMSNANARSYARLNYTNDRKWSFEFDGEKYGADLTKVLSNTTDSKLQVFCYNAGNPVNASRFVYGRVFFANVSLEDEVAAKLVPTIDSTGTPCMHDSISGQNFYNKGTGSFVVGFDTTEKAAVSLSKLPVTTGGTLTVSLPAEAEDTATLVPAAIDIAKSRGWTIITQYRTN